MDKDTQENAKEIGKSILTSPAGLGFVTGGAVEVATLIGRMGPNGILLAGSCAVVAGMFGKDIVNGAKSLIGIATPLGEGQSDDTQLESDTVDMHKRTLLDRALGRNYAQPKEANQGDMPTEEDIQAALKHMMHEGEDDFFLPGAGKRFDFSEVLQKFKPGIDRVYLCQTPTGERIYCTAEELCHVALAGSTDGGKSSIMRLLMAQLCKVGCEVILLNPHYTHYDIKKNEDWTPFLPYLKYDPMVMRAYSEIERVLHHAAHVVLPKRLERHAQSRNVGKPIFIVIDELPAIVDHVPVVPKYLQALLREGRKANIFLITASQNYLVKTVSPDEGGADRDNYRTVYYTGGDATTATKLLKLLAAKIPETSLGKGVAMFRSNTVCKQAISVLVPYVDNQSLYSLLGPSTYIPGDDSDESGDDFDVTRNVPLSQNNQNKLKMEPDGVTRNVRNVQPEVASQNGVQAQNEGVLPVGWTQEDVTLLPRFYKVLNNIDKSLDALEIATGQRNRDFAKEILKQKGLWKDK